MKPLLCILGMHTGLIDSRYQFKGYDRIEDDIKGLPGHGNIHSIYYKSCGNCGKDLGEQKFSMGWYPKSFSSILPHSAEECMQYARAFQSNSGETTNWRTNAKSIF